MSFKTNLQALRAKRNMTQEQLAMLLGVSRQAISKWESEKAYPEMDKLLMICDLFGCSLDDLVLGDVEQPQTDNTHSASQHERAHSSLRSASGDGGDTHPAASMTSVNASLTYMNPEQNLPVDVTGYDQERKSFSFRIALGVAVIILAVAVCRLFDVDDQGLVIGSIGLSEFLSVASVFIGVAAGLALIVPSGLAYASFKRRHPYVEDFYSESDRSLATRYLGIAIVVGITLILVGIATVVYEENVFAGRGSFLAEAFMLACVAGAVFGFVYYGMSYGLMNVNEYNQHAEDEQALHDEIGKSEKDKELKKFTGAICSIIMLTSTIIALFGLFVGMGEIQIWGMAVPFWIPWVIGGVLCALVEPIMIVFRRL